MEGEYAEPNTSDYQANRPTTSDRLFIALMVSSTVSAGRTKGAVSTVSSQYHAPSRSPLAAARAAAWRGAGIRERLSRAEIEYQDAKHQLARPNGLSKRLDSLHCKLP